MIVPTSAVRSRFGYPGDYVGFGFVCVEQDRLVTWMSLPLLWRFGLRFARRENTIDRERCVYLSGRPRSLRNGLLPVLYVPLEGGRWIHTSVRGVEQQLRDSGLRIEVGKPPGLP